MLIGTSGKVHDLLFVSYTVQVSLDHDYMHHYIIRSLGHGINRDSFLEHLLLFAYSMSTMSIDIL